MLQHHPTSPRKPHRHFPSPPQAAHILISWPNEAGALSAKLNQWESASMPSLFHFSHQQSHESDFMSASVFVPLVVFLICVSIYVLPCSMCVCVCVSMSVCVQTERHNKMSVLPLFDKKLFVCGILPVTTIKGIRLPRKRKSHHRLHLH